MAALETKHIFNGSIEQVYHGISRFDLYPKYLPGVTGIKVDAPHNPKAISLVTYELNIVKTFFYALEMYTEAPNKIWWHLVESNLMKENTGSWHFKSLEQNKTEATYTLDIKFKGFVPSMITDPIAKANLPLMFQGFQKMIDDVKK